MIAKANPVRAALAEASCLDSPYAFNGTMPVVADHDAQLLVGDFTRRAPTVFARDDVRAVVAALRAVVRFVRTHVYPARLGHESKHITFICGRCVALVAAQMPRSLGLMGEGSAGNVERVACYTRSILELQRDVQSTADASDCQVGGNVAIPTPHRPRRS